MISYHTKQRYENRQILFPQAVLEKYVVVGDGQNWLRSASKTFLDICGVESLGYFINRRVVQLTVYTMQHLHYIKHRTHD